MTIQRNPKAIAATIRGACDTIERDPAFLAFTLNGLRNLAARLEEPPPRPLD